MGALEVFENSSTNGNCAESILLSLQAEQLEHDEGYHKEISRLNIQDRLRHITLHFAKYAGQLLQLDENDQEFQRLLTDVFIISLSCTNVLNRRVWDELHCAVAEDPADLAELGRHLAGEEDVSKLNVDAFARVVAINAGRMSAAAEKLDHLEDFPFRRAFNEGCISLAAAAITFAGVRGWDLASMTRDRLTGVKQKNSLHGRL